jgi:dihydroflavonol-4-reductase
MKAAITGITGVLGANLAALLTERGHEVVGLVRKTSRVGHLEDLPLHYREASLADVEALSRAFEGAEVVFHCAALTSMWRGDREASWRVNVEGTRNVLEAVRRAGAGRLVHTSTVDAFGLPEPGKRVTEETAFNKDRLGLDSGYASSKRAAQDLVEEAAAGGMDAVVVNPSFLIGARDEKLSSGRLVLEVMRGRTFVWTDGIKNFVDVRAVARGMWSAFESGEPGRCYIFGGDNLPIRDFLRLVARVAGVAPPRVRLPRPAGRVLGLAGEAASVLARRELPLNRHVMRMAYVAQPVSSQRAMSELGYDVGDLEEAVARCVADLRRRGYAS